MTANSQMNTQTTKTNQFLPIIVAVAVFIVLSLVFYGQISLLNQLPFVSEKIFTQIKIFDVLVGLTIYLKTSIDFALLIGNLMHKYPGTKNRYAIEIGTAAGNALGTMLVLLVWVFFKEVKILLALMVIFASLVLFELADSSIDHLEEQKSDLNPTVRKCFGILKRFLDPILKVLGPVLSKVMPDLKPKIGKSMSFGGLLLASFTVPFILGLDDFAGYVTLFSVVNVFGFGIGVFLGHMILNILLFVNPDRTIKIIKNPIIALLGGTAFIILALFGLFEGAKIILELVHVI